MSYMDAHAAFAPAGGIQELSFDEIEEVGGLFFVPVLIFLGKAAAAGIAGTAAVGFADGLIEGFKDKE